MAIMRSVKRLIWIFRLLIFTVMKGALPNVSATVVIGMNNTSALFECSASATLRCNAGNSFAKWQIAYRVEPGTNSSAQCLGNECLVQNNFTGRYKFTYSSATGISDLQIDPIVIEDDGREYKCNDGTQSPLRATVKHVLRNNSVSLLNETSDEGSRITFNVTIDCTPENVNITWFSTAIDGTDFQIHKETSHNEIDCLTGNCVVLGTSKYISSLLELVVVPTNKRRRKGTVEGRTFGFNVTSDSGIVSRWIPGTYKLNAADALETPVGFELIRDSVTEVSAAFRCIPKLYQPGEQEIVLICQQGNNGSHKAENSHIIDETGARAITLKINTLRQGSVYDCFVFARSNNIRSENSHKIRIKTLGLPDAPTDFRVLRVENNSIHLSWIPGRYRMNQQCFVLELMNMKHGDITLESIRMAHDNPIMHTVESLPTGTTFLIKLHAQNSVGRSDIVGPIKVTTSGNPEPPSELKETGVTSSTISISWRPGTYRRQTQYFVIEYGRTKKKLENIKWKQEKKVDDGQTVMMYTLNNLKSETTYIVVLFAINDIGTSTRTLPLLVHTKEENLDNNRANSENDCGINSTEHESVAIAVV